jgi:sporulation protein YlmC with PRC-barrel domain
MRLSELLRRSVVTESGRKLGHVHDVRAVQRGERLLVIGIVVGQHGLLEHFGVGIGAGRRGTTVRHTENVVPWEAVVRVASGKVVVRDGTELPGI